MNNAYSIAHLTALGLNPPQLIEAASNAGAQYVGLRLNRTTPDEPLYDLINDRALMRETKARLAATGIKVWDIEAARMDPLRDHLHYQDFLEAGAELGAKYVLTQLPDWDRSRAVDRFGAFCDMAKPLNLNVSLEFVSWTDTPNLVEAARVLREVNRQNATMLVDLLHFDRSYSSLELLATLPRDWFKWAHVCDAPADHPVSLAQAIYTARCERRLPGEGGLDVKGILDCLPADIVYALEIPGEPTVEKIGYSEYIRRSVETTQRHLDEISVE
ncbi:sugar phosphate isomerase/epimerase family protein [Burkholderia glumae]|uniref:TIM barrel protein n=2 Tax=Burkholderia glumae TaxID=337 RepID=A0AAQ0BVI4_BURGL|nr:TIM barrel protein [Burkholderia glumae]ACR28910.1 xylose isomerase domain-containing protein [Burkholderia glumae BGR1]AJY66469.1 xylose isomerase-like TIM barrel family protein [Burkholderia glumae LMG 2196 = ATCC 33617]KHJ61960.1 xylose isomerase [Burkholderia glumae]MCM2483252.1 TIM barrel protein [Burkholderia glumae]MCM2506569.1 TIM barrel protein [Burkholderia glumae]